LAWGACHAGQSGDVAAAADRVTTLCPKAPLTIVGFSLGGNITLKLLAEVGQSAPGNLDSAIVVSPPLDLQECCRHLQRGTSRFYNRMCVRLLMRQLRRRPEVWASLKAGNPRRSPRTVYEFDQRFTAPMSGFASADDYYQRCSAGPDLAHIRIPTRVLAAADDPMVPVTTFRKLAPPPSVRVDVTRHGGHLGYVAAPGADADRRWMDWRIVQWVLELPGALDRHEQLTERAN
jgi:predicted alpha/beta-fold hydrolase